MLQSFIAGTSELELETVDDVTSESGTERGKCVHIHALACCPEAQFLDFDSPYLGHSALSQSVPLQLHDSSCRMLGVVSDQITWGFGLMKLFVELSSFTLRNNNKPLIGKVLRLRHL